MSVSGKGPEHDAVPQGRLRIRAVQIMAGGIGLLGLVLLNHLRRVQRHDKHATDLDKLSAVPAGLPPYGSSHADTKSPYPHSVP